MESLLRAIIGIFIILIGLFMFFITIKMNRSPEKFTSSQIRIGKKTEKVQFLRKDGVKLASYFLVLMSILIVIGGITFFF